MLLPRKVSAVLSSPLLRRPYVPGSLTLPYISLTTLSVPTDAMDTWKDLFGSIGGRVIKGVFQVIGQSTTDAAATAIYLAASKDVETREQKGKYFIPVAKEDPTSKAAEDKDLARKLWCWCDDEVTKGEQYEPYIMQTLTKFEQPLVRVGNRAQQK